MVVVCLMKMIDLSLNKQEEAPVKVTAVIRGEEGDIVAVILLIEGVHAIMGAIKKMSATTATRVVTGKSRVEFICVSRQ
jgi:hypothetical protein